MTLKLYSVGQQCLHSVWSSFNGNTRYFIKKKLIMRIFRLPICSSVRGISCFIVQTTRRTTIKLHLGSKLKFELNLILFGTGHVKPK
jgi:hypothetical protein